MNIIRYEPFRELERVFGDAMRQVAGDFWSGKTLSDKVFNDGGTFIPRVDVAEDEKNIMLHVELPGLTKEDVSVTVTSDRTLVIKGEKKRETKSEGTNYLRVERGYGSFTRSFGLPEYANAETVSAAFDKGVLTVTLAKSEPAAPKQIAVEIK